MALPKRRHSKSRRDKRRFGQRRSGQGLVSPSLSLCPQCKRPKLSHRVCLFCGYYKGKQVIEIKEKKKKKK